MRSKLLHLIAVLPVVLAGCSASEGAEPEQGESADAVLSGGYPVGTELQTTADVNHRKGPNASSAVLQLIPQGTVVRSGAANPSGGWYGVSWNGKTGWVDGRYLTRASASTPPSGTYSRQQVYDLVAPHAKGGGSARDLLDPGLTTQKLVNALGWLATHAPPDWGFSVINSGHHFDPRAHSGGFAIDLFANNAADDFRFMGLVNEDPYFVEIGVSGDYVAYRGRITSAGKCSFVESAPTHVHASVQRAFC
ncbi:hypothetical protein BH11MYX4_BH11MYX4_04070 [soil metagenome]